MSLLHTPPQRQSRHTKLLGLFALGIASAASFAPPAEAVSLQQGFAGSYAPANWTFSATGGDGSVDSTGAPNSITLYNSDSYTFNFYNTDYTTTAFTSGTISFNWDYSTSDTPGYDGFGYLLNGAFTLLTDSAPSSGSTQFNVATGDIFGFRAYATDDCCGRASVAISNYSAPVPGPLPLLGIGAAFSYSRRLRRRTSLTDGSLSAASQISDRV